MITAMTSGAPWKSPLHQMTQTTATCLWNDSADLDELRFSLEHGGVGATCNPVIAYTVLKARMPEWRPRIEALIRELPAATEEQIGWAVVEQDIFPGYGTPQESARRSRAYLRNLGL